MNEQHVIKPGTLPMFLTRDEVAHIFGVAQRTVDRMISDGTLPATKLGKRLVRIPGRAVERIVNTNAMEV